jgi:hypothetical protein
VSSAGAPVVSIANSSLGGIGVSITRAKVSPLIGVYVTVGRSLKVPPTPTATSSEKSKLLVKKFDPRSILPSRV